MAFDIGIYFIYLVYKSLYQTLLGYTKISADFCLFSKRELWELCGPFETCLDAKLFKDQVLVVLGTFKIL